MDRLCPLLLVLVLLPANVRAQSPRLHFDMPFTVACRDVTPPEFSVASPNQRLVEARFEISALLLAGRERDLSQFFIRIDSPRRTLTVVDYLPKTLHESQLAGPIGISTTKESNASLGINLAGKYEVLTSIGANAGLGKKNTSCVKCDLLPPLETVAASGTLLRGAGVFFKLKAGPRRLLEGATQFALVLRVPSDWRTDHVRVHCEAEAVHRGLVGPLDQNVRAGQGDFLVALYLEGDEAARLTAEQFARQSASGVEGRKKPKPQHSDSVDLGAWSLNLPAWELLQR
jgi:hypothetical protein